MRHSTSDRIGWPARGMRTPGRMVASGEMVAQMGMHRVAILCDEDSAFALCPQQHGGVVRRQRQVGCIAYAQHIKQVIAAAKIEPQDGLPQRATQVFIQNKRQRHVLTNLCLGRGRLTFGQAGAE